MSLAFFFVETISAIGNTQFLSEESSRHVVQVLRMVNGDELRLTDGKGRLATAVITDAHKKKCEVLIREIVNVPPSPLQHTIAISLLKNNTRLEWFLEKAAELGIWRIVPLLCTRTEKQHFRFDRMNAILVSAMLQSQQPWQTQLLQPISYKDFVNQQIGGSLHGFIAHCAEGEKRSLSVAVSATTQLVNDTPGPESALPLTGLSQRLVLIGPEGDFTAEEISVAIDAGFVPVELGNTRLRTETAGLVAATLIQLL